MYVNGKPVFIRIYLLVCVVFTVISTVITSALVLFSETSAYFYGFCFSKTAYLFSSSPASCQY